MDLFWDKRPQRAYIQERVRNASFDSVEKAVGSMRYQEFKGGIEYTGGNEFIDKAKDALKPLHLVTVESDEQELLAAGTSRIGAENEGMELFYLLNVSQGYKDNEEDNNVSLSLPANQLLMVDTKTGRCTDVGSLGDCQMVWFQKEARLREGEATEASYEPVGIPAMNEVRFHHVNSIEDVYDILHEVSHVILARESEELDKDAAKGIIELRMAEKRVQGGETLTNEEKERVLKYLAPVLNMEEMAWSVARDLLSAMQEEGKNFISEDSDFEKFESHAKKKLNTYREYKEILKGEGS